jgi:hypothetical protein
MGNLGRGTLATPVMAGAAAAALLLVFGTAGVRTSAAAKRKQDEQRAIPLVQDCLGKLGLLDRGVTINVETMNISGSERPSRRFWVAECNDTDGEYVAYVLVDSRSGELVSATCRSRDLPTEGDQPLNRSAAVARAAEVARRCTPISATAGISLNGEPERIGDSWYVELKCGRRIVSVSLQASTGEVIALTTRRRDRT